MVYISLDELLPTAENYGEHHVAIGGVVAGMAFIGFGLLIF
jgi:ZIP family zinc transporter